MMIRPAEQLAQLDLTVYTAAWCPDCRRLAEWLEREGVRHTTVGIDDTPGAAEKLEAETGKRAIPFILVNGTRWVRGYHKEDPRRFNAEVLVRELVG